MSPLPQNSDGGILDSANTLPVANPNLFYHPIIGARFTPIHFILIILLIQIPLYMFLSYQGLIKKWTYERYITAKRSYYTPIPTEKDNEKEEYCEYIDLEAALQSIDPPDDAADLLRLDITDDAGFPNSPRKTFDAIELERALAAIQREDSPGPAEPELLHKSGFSYTPLTEEELTSLSEGLDPIIYSTHKPKIRDFAFMGTAEANEIKRPKEAKTMRMVDELLRTKLIHL